MNRVTITMVDELSGIRHSMAFVRFALAGLLKELPEPKAITGCELILRGLEEQLKDIEKDIEADVTGKSEERKIRGGYWFS